MIRSRRSPVTTHKSKGETEFTRWKSLVEWSGVIPETELEDLANYISWDAFVLFCESSKDLERVAHVTGEDYEFLSDLRMRIVEELSKDSMNSTFPVKDGRVECDDSLCKRRAVIRHFCWRHAIFYAKQATEEQVSRVPEPYHLRPGEPQCQTIIPRTTRRCFRRAEQALTYCWQHKK